MRTTIPSDETAARGVIGNLLGFSDADAGGQESPAEATGISGNPALPVRRLQLQNIGSHRKTDLCFDHPVTFIVGPNNHGKSTIAEGLLWALTGKFARGLDGRGLGLDALVQTGRSAARAVVELKGLELMRETKAGKARLTAGDGSVDPQVAIYQALKTNEGKLRALFQGALLIDADHAAGNQLLLDVLQVRIPYKDETLTLAQLEARYTKAFEERRDAKRDRAAVTVPPKPEDDAPDVAALEQLLRDLREEEKTLIASSSTAAGARTQLQRRLDELQRERQQLETRIADVGDPAADLAALDEECRSLEDDAAADADEGVAATMEADARELATLREGLVDAGGRLRLLTTSVEEIDAHSPTKGCVLNADVPCKTPAKAFTGFLEEARAAIETIKEQQHVAETRIASLEESARARAEAVAAHSQAVRAMNDRRARIDAAAEGLRVAQERLDIVLEQVATAQTDLANLGTVEEPAELTTLRQRIAAGDQRVPEARALVRQWEAHRITMTKADALVKTINRLEVEVADLGPKGIRVQALATALEAFLARINTALGPFGYRLAIELEPWKVLVNGRIAARLSDSERFRLAVCLQLAFAEYSGLGFAVIDNADVLVTPETRALFNELVIGWALAAVGRQLLVIAAKDDSWRMPAIPGVGVFRVRMDGDGVTTLAAEETVAAA